MCRRTSKPEADTFISPIRLDIHGREIELSRFELRAILREMTAQKAATADAKKLRFTRGLQPFSQLHMDIVGHWQFSGTKVYLITAMDDFSKYVKVKWCLHCPTAANCAEFLLELVREARTTPQKVVVDNGPQFASAEFRAVLTALNAEHEAVGAYAHWAAGTIERWHRVLNAKCGIAKCDNNDSLRKGKAKFRSESPPRK
jgi:transposase InsO family protein